MKNKKKQIYNILIKFNKSYIKLLTNNIIFLIQKYNINIYIK